MRKFDERARENNYDLLYKNECQNWRNKINKAKRTASPKEFTDCLYQQSNIIVRLADI